MERQHDLLLFQSRLECGKWRCSLCGNKLSSKQRLITHLDKIHGKSNLQPSQQQIPSRQTIWRRKRKACELDLRECTSDPNDELTVDASTSNDNEDEVDHVLANDNQCSDQFADYYVAEDLNSFPGVCLNQPSLETTNLNLKMTFKYLKTIGSKSMVHMMKTVNNPHKKFQAERTLAAVKM